MSGVASSIKNGASAFDVLKTAGSGALSIISSHKIIAVTAAITGLVAIIRYIATAGERANEKMEESVQAYNDAKSSAEELNTELETTISRIKELESKQPNLTLVEQQELNKLRESVELMQIQDDLAEKEVARKAREAAEDTVKAYQKNFKYQVVTPESVQEAYDNYILGRNASDGRLPNMVAAVKQATEARDALDESADGYATQYQTYTTTIDNLTDRIWEQANTLIEYRENLETIPEDLRTEKQQKALDEISTSIEYIYQQLDPAKWNEMGFDRILGQDQFKNAKQSLIDLARSMENTGKKISVEDITSGLKEVPEQAEEAYQEYAAILQEMKEEGIKDTGQTKFGNIDLDNRQILTWTQENLQKYKQALMSWDDEASSDWNQFAKDMENSISTVFGASEEFDGVEIAFSPMLQTEDGAVLLTRDTVVSYINKLISEASKDGQWTNEDLFQLDSQGIGIVTEDGYVIKGLIADIGDEAKDTGKAMHYFGKDGALKTAYRNLDKALTKVRDKMGGNGIDVDTLREKYGDLAVALENNGFSLEDFCTWINTEAGLIGDASDATNNYKQSVDDAANAQVNFTDAMKETETALNNYQSLIQSAMESSKSAVGMTIEEVQNLDSAFQNLEGYDATKLFEETANGIHANGEELERLNKQYLDNKIAEQLEKINDIQWQIYNQRSKGLDTSALEKELTTARLLKSEYEGMTSAYNAYLRAKSGGSERDIYESIGSDYQAMQETLSQGWYGDEQLNAYLDFLINVDKRTGDATKDFALLTQTIEGTNHSIMDYWRQDEDGNLVTDGLYDFLDDVNKLLGDSYAKFNEETGKYEFDFEGEKLEEVARQFGITTEAVEMFERAMIAAGFAVDLTDMPVIDQIKRLQDELTEFQNSDIISKGLDLDIDVDTADLADVQDFLTQLENERVQIDAEANPEAAATLDHLIELTSQTYYLRLDAETDGGLVQAVNIINRIKEIQQQGPVGVDVDVQTNNADELYVLADKLSKLPPEVQTTVGVTVENVGNKDAILDQIKQHPETLNVPVAVNALTSTANKDIDKVNDKEVEDKTFTVKANDEASSKLKGIQRLVDNLPTHKLLTVTTRQVTEKVDKSGDVVTQTTNGGKAVAHGHAEGTAQTFADGSLMLHRWRSTTFSPATGLNWALPNDQTALVNEIGAEGLVRDGKFYVIPGGAHIEQFKKGDIIFSNEQLKELFTNGVVKSGGGRGRVAQKDGTAYNTLNLNAYENGSGPNKRPGYGNSTSVADAAASKASSSSSKSSKSSDKDKEEEFKETLDWIEVMIDRIERSISTLDTLVNSTYSRWSDRNANLRSELSEVRQEIDIQRQGYNRYIQEANSVGLSEDWAKKVRDGLINIEDITDETLADQISEYRDWYEKALDCRDAIVELNESVSELYETAFNNVVTQFDGVLSKIEHERSMIEESINQSETQGYITSAKYYDALVMNELEHIGQLTNERIDLLREFQNAVNSGTIKEGSEAWAEMRDQINDVTLALKESDTTLMEYYNNIREVGWEVFDLMQDRMSQVTSEADFLINLLDNKKLYDDRGQLTNEGMSTMGLHGVDYNTYMAQADKYAEEIQRISREIASDPYDQELLNRRQELLEAQRDNILAAEKEKDAIRDMVEEGIKLELEALQELIDKYTDALDAQKDLYDYSKKLSEMTDEIASLEKQRSAYAGDNSEENRVRLQQIEAQLKESRENLEETEYDKYVSDQKELLDSLYTEYEEILNARLDNLDALIMDMIEAINNNAGTISSTLTSASESVGYTMSESMTNIWSAGAAGITDVLTTYGQNIENGILSASTTLNTVLNGIGVDIKSMIEQLNVIAGTRIQTDTTTSAENLLKSPRDQIADMYRELLGRNARSDEVDYWAKLVSSGKSMDDVRKGIMGSVEYIIRSLYHELLGRDPDATGSKQWSDKLRAGASVEDVRRGIMGSVEYMKRHGSSGSAGSTGSASSKPAAQSKPARDEKDNYGVALAAINGNYGWGTGKTRNNRLTQKGFDAARVEAIINQLFKDGYIRNGTWPGKYYGIKDLSPYHYNKYAKGGLIDYTGIAQVDGEPSEPELVLNPKDTKNFIALKDALKDIADGSNPLLNIFKSKFIPELSTDFRGINPLDNVDQTRIGNITYEFNIPIDHVMDYNDFVNKVCKDGRFEKYVQSVTVGQATGDGKLVKNKYKW